MNFEGLRQALESNDLYSEAVVANDVGSFLRIISRQSVARELRRFISERAENVVDLARYLDELFAQAREGEYRFENDVAIATCLYVLSATATPEAERLLRLASDTNLRSLSWVQAIAKHFSGARPSTTVITLAFPARPELHERHEMRVVERVQYVRSSSTRRDHAVAVPA